MRGRAVIAYRGSVFLRARVSCFHCDGVTVAWCSEPGADSVILRRGGLIWGGGKLALNVYVALCARRPSEKK